MGTPDANGAQAKASGFAYYNVMVGDLGTRRRGRRVTRHGHQRRAQAVGLGDYTGQLQVTASLSIVNSYNGATPVTRPR